MAQQDDLTDLEDPIDLDLNDEEENDENETPEETEDDAEGGRDGSDGDPPLKERTQEDVQDGQILKGGRKTQAVLRAKEAQRQAEERAEETQRTLLQLQEEVRQLRNPRVDPELERQRLEFMTPEERIKAYKDEIDTKIKISEFRAFESSDKAAFDSKAAVNPVYAKYSSQVEKILHQERLQGRNHPREELLKYLVGDAVLKRGAAAGAKGRKTGASNIKKQTTKSGSAQSNVPSSKREMTLEEKLDGVFI